MTKFKVGDIIKKPNGKYTYKILATNKNRVHIFGNWFVKNMETGRNYFVFGNQKWIICDPFKPKNTKRKFSFKNGVQQKTY